MNKIIYSYAISLEVLFNTPAHIEFQISQTCISFLSIKLENLIHEVCAIFPIVNDKKQRLSEINLKV